MLIARDRDGEPFRGDDRATEARARVAAEEDAFLGLVRALELSLDLNALAVFARWITPASSSPRRFDTPVLSSPAPTASSWRSATARRRWTPTWIAPPAEALELAKTGARKVVFPTRMNLQLLAESASATGGPLVRARSRTLITVQPRREEREGGAVLVLPLEAGYESAIEEPVAKPVR